MPQLRKTKYFLKHMSCLVIHKVVEIALLSQWWSDRSPQGPMYECSPEDDCSSSFHSHLSTASLDLGDNFLTGSLAHSPFFLAKLISLL